VRWCSLAHLWGPWLAQAHQRLNLRHQGPPSECIGVGKDTTCDEPGTCLGSYSTNQPAYVQT
jgi:hypothetical protein